MSIIHAGEQEVMVLEAEAQAAGDPYAYLESRMYEYAYTDPDEHLGLSWLEGLSGGTPRRRGPGRGRGWMIERCREICG